MSAPCYVTNDHSWRGGGACVVCGKRLRCGFCQQFVREDQLGIHEITCSYIIAHLAELEEAAREWCICAHHVDSHCDHDDNYEIGPCQECTCPDFDHGQPGL